MDGNNGPLIAAGGGLLLFISEFLDWFDVLGSAWEFMDIVDVVLAVLALIAIAIGAMLATGNTANLPSSPGRDRDDLGHHRVLDRGHVHPRR